MPKAGHTLKEPAALKEDADPSTYATANEMSATLSRNHRYFLLHIKSGRIANKENCDLSMVWRNGIVVPQLPGARM